MLYPTELRAEISTCGQTQILVGGGEIRTPDILLPKQARYQTTLHPVNQGNVNIAQFQNACFESFRINLRRTGIVILLNFRKISTAPDCFLLVSLPKIAKSHQFPSPHCEVVLF